MTLDIDFLQRCYSSNALGDAQLFIHLHGERFRYNKATGGWLEWQGHYWELDLMGRAEAAVEDVAQAYLTLAENIEDQIDEFNKTGRAALAKAKTRELKGIIGRINRLRDCGGRVSCLTFAHTCDKPIAIKGDELDQDPWLLACPNGVIDLRDGCLYPGKQHQWISKSSPVRYPGLDAQAILWEKTLLEIFDDDQELVDYIQRLFGYCLTGLTREAIFPVFCGRGRNGKSLIVGILTAILGSLAGTIQASMLLDQGRVRSSSGPSADIMALHGLRFAFASETDENRRFSPAQIKWLTGNDMLTGRDPFGKREVNFRPTHSLILLTNHRPHASAGDFAFWERMHLVPFNLSFVDRDPVTDNERRADKLLAKNLQAELPGILAWLVRGCLLYQDETLGLKRPAAVLAATENYNREEDVLLGWLEDENYVYLDPHARTNGASLYTSFIAWWEANNGKHAWKPSSRSFGEELVKRYERRKTGGCNVYVGIGVLDQGGG